MGCASNWGAGQYVSKVSIMSSESRQFLELLFGRGGTRVAQPLGHRWLYSVTESRRTAFSETASVRTTWDSSPAGSCPGAVDERLFFLGSNFSSEWMTSDSSPADSCSDMVYEGRVLLQQHGLFCLDDLVLNSSVLRSGQGP